MKIINVEAFLMSCPMPEPIRLPFWGGERVIVKRDAMLVRITTDNGLKGFSPGPAHLRAHTEIQTTIKPFLLGKSPCGWRDFKPDFEESIYKTYKAVELALMDLEAQNNGCALSEVAGGRQRDTIKVYGSAGMYMPPEAYAQEAAAIKQMGYSGYKMRPALGYEQDLLTVELMRQAVGEDFELMVDAHTWWRMGELNYHVSAITELIEAMAAYRPCWVEEPLPPDDHDAYAEIRTGSKVPIASGEHEQNFTGFQHLIACGAVDYVQLDVCCQGGHETLSQVLALTEQAGLKFAFHNWGTDLELLAAAHLGICWPESVVEWLERPCYANGEKPGMYPFPLAEEILADPLEMVDGKLVISDHPGLGVEVNEQVIEKYPYIPGPWSFFELKSSSQVIAVTGDHSLKWI